MNREEIIALLERRLAGQKKSYDICTEEGMDDAAFPIAYIIDELEYILKIIKGECTEDEGDSECDTDI